MKAEKAKHIKDNERAKQKKLAQTPQNSASRKDGSSPCPYLPHSSGSSPSSVVASATQEDQKRFAEAALRMIAEDMLPLRCVLLLMPRSVIRLVEFMNLE